MKACFITGIALFGMQGLAFPAAMFNTELHERTVAELMDIAKRIGTEVRRTAPRGTFDPVAQYVPNTGNYSWMPPGPGDLRGPCPGLNVLANHGYIPRNGIATMPQIIQASTQVLGMGVDLSTFLAIYAVVMAGDLTKVSIGDKPPSDSLLLSLLGLKSAPQGLSHCHNRFEGDVSPTRGDLYNGGDAWSLDINAFQTLYNMPLGPNGYDMSVMNKFRSLRFNQSIATNPYMFNGPYTGLFGQTATFLFTYQMFKNHSAAYPDGYLDGNTLKSFFGVTGNNGSFQWQPGYERIPDNYYRRPIGYEYGFALFGVDGIATAIQYPYMFVLGGNTGKVNTFTGVDLGNLTGGVFNAQTLIQGNNLMCFAFQAVQNASPDILKGLLSSVASVLSTLNNAIGNVIGNLGCPQLAAYDTTQFAKFPGAKGTFN